MLRKWTRVDIMYVYDIVASITEVEFMGRPRNGSYNKISIKNTI
ncbi:hypothetical protein SAMN04488601_1012853 [Paenibacillus sp. 453mf]|nr:hypothetical protein SAMN04488601_1012853 [Paenibacillus sp. 453mf]